MDSTEIAKKTVKVLKNWGHYKHHENRKKMQKIQQKTIFPILSRFNPNFDYIWGAFELKKLPGHSKFIEWRLIMKL